MWFLLLTIHEMLRHILTYEIELAYGWETSVAEAELSRIEKSEKRKIGDDQNTLSANPGLAKMRESLEHPVPKKERKRLTFSVSLKPREIEAEKSRAYLYRPASEQLRNSGGIFGRLGVDLVT